MAGASSITLRRSDDATIALQFQAQQAAQTLITDLTTGKLTLEITAYPAKQPILSISPDDLSSGCSLTVTDGDEGRASLFIPAGFWGTASRYLVEAWFASPSGRQRFGDHLIEITE